MKQKIYILILLLVSSLTMLAGSRDVREYRCEIGLQGGMGYYTGDAEQHIFQHVREAYGAHFRYKLHPRWALTVKGLQHTVVIPKTIVRGDNGQDMILPSRLNHMGNIDVTGEFNFFRMGQYQYDRRYKPYAPYIFLGVGCGIYEGTNGKMTAAAYLPLGIGFKWQFHPRWGMHIAWQHNLYFTDNVEGESLLSDRYQMNGSNFLNDDLTSQLTLGIVFAFAREKKVCKTCQR